MALAVAAPVAVAGQRATGEDEEERAGREQHDERAPKTDDEIGRRHGRRFPSQHRPPA
jgi:hypothetical protein